ncbi:MAG: adenylate/guanylate cyclase domain-containing protein [Solirubrobacteraceae bacterium]
MDILRKPLRVAYRRLGPRYPRVMLFAQFQLTFLIVLGGVGLLSLYVPLSSYQLLHILAVAAALVVVENVLSLRLVFRLVGAADPWLRGARDPQSAAAAWRALAGLPLDFARRRGALLAIAMNVGPIAVYVWAELGLALYALPVLFAAAAVVLLYGALVRYLATELIVRPVLEEISPDLPDGIAPTQTGVSLKVKLMVAIPAINVVCGVIVAGLSTRGHGRIADLGVDVGAALAVALTISLELTVLLSRSILEPLSDLRGATGRVAGGDYSVRVPVISGDETGVLANSFNEMVAGLEERERLREAFGAFVDPHLAARVMREGSIAGGEEVVVSVLFLDIRDFTAFAERASAAEVVAQLNEFYELVVPIIASHGGHANKFIGDGLLSVFGAPEQLPDHADRAVRCALELVDAVAANFNGTLCVGVGVNSGPVVAGTIGGGGRLDFTVIGDTVNTAARVEEATRHTGDAVLITQSTRGMLSGGRDSLLPRPPVELKGKRESVELYAPCLDRVAPWQPKPSLRPSSTAAG